MTTIYFVRHVQAAGNKNRVFQGRTDTDVSDDGRIQLENLVGRFSSVALDRIYVSDLKRARLTAEAVRGGRDIEELVDERIREINAGVWENQPVMELSERYPEAMRRWREEIWNFETEGSETMRDVYARTGAALDDILKENDGKTVAVVSHGCALKNMLCYALGWPIERLFDVPWLGNGSVTKLVFDGGLPGTPVYTNDIAHIDENTILAGMNALIKERSEQ